MKALDQLNNVERAKLLHDLFPGEIAGFLEYAKGLSIYIDENKEQIKKNWGEQLFAFDAWLELALSAKATIEEFETKLVKNGRLFSHQLFDGYLALWTADAACKYIEDDKFPNSKFKKVVQALFCGGE